MVFAINCWHEDFIPFPASRNGQEHDELLTRTENKPIDPGSAIATPEQYIRIKEVPTCHFPSESLP